MHINKAHGLYSCPTRILRSVRHILSKPLADIMNKSVSQGVYPSKLKHAKVIPVYKSEDETDPGNYSAWGQAAQLHLNKLLLLQKRAIRFMNFSKPRTHAVPLFISSKILPINMLYFETMSTLMYDISNNSVPQNISRLFSKSNSIHPYKTRSSSSGNFYIQYSCLNQQRNSTTRFGARVWNCLPPQVRQLPKKQFKKKVREILFAIFHAEDTYVEAPTLLLKMTKYVK